MPIYEYLCEGCDKHIEVVQKISADPLTKCGSCGGKLNKLISQSSFHLKGSGWYVTDYGRKGAESEKKKEAESEKKKEADKAPPTKESKPEPKKTSKGNGDKS